MNQINGIIQTSTEVVNSLAQEQKKGVLSRVKDFFFSLLGYRAPDQLMASRLQDITHSLSQKKAKLAHLNKKLEKLKGIQKKQSFVSMRSQIDLDNKIGEVEKKIKEIEEQVNRKLEKQVNRIIRIPLFQKEDKRFNAKGVCEKTSAFYEQTLSLLEEQKSAQRVGVIDQLIAVKRHQISLLSEETTGTKSLADRQTQLENEIDSLENKKLYIRS